MFTVEEMQDFIGSILKALYDLVYKIFGDKEINFGEDTTVAE